ALAAQRLALYLATGDGALWRWTADDGWAARAALPAPVVRGQVVAVGQAHLLWLLDAGDGERPRLYHVITDAWSDWPGATPAGATGLARGNGVLWAAPGGGLREVRLETGKHLLGVADWLVIALYMAAVLGMGFWFYLRDQTASASDYFVGGRSIPFWAAGISLYATNTSSISFIAIPAKAFDTNWQYMTNNLMAVIGLVFVAVWIVPLLRRLDLMSVFSYLETRFHPAIRMLSSALCIVMQIGARMSVILFLPALAISTITGLDVVWSILMMGVFTIVYATVGGSRAVIWTDVVQVLVMFGGALFAVGFVFWQSGAELPQLMAAAAAEDKTRLLDFSFDLTKATVWGFVFLVVFDVVLTFPKDQVLMQRALSTTDDKAAGRSIWAFAAIMIPGGFVFYGIGTALWMYYRDNPERLNPLLPVDATFPLFIAAELPVGVTGLIIAGIFAAAMSTLSSIINSVGTLVSVDFYQKLARSPDEKTAVRIAEWSGVMVGAVGIAIALLMSRYDIQSLFVVSYVDACLLRRGYAVEQPHSCRHPGFGEFLTEADQVAGREDRGAHRRMVRGDDGRGRVRDRAADEPLRHPVAVRRLDRAGRPARRRVRRRLHPGHVHPPRQLARGGDRGGRFDRHHPGLLVDGPGASVLLPGDLDRAVHRDRLRGQPVLPAALAFAGGADDPHPRALTGPPGRLRPGPRDVIMAGHDRHVRRLPERVVPVGHAVSLHLRQRGRPRLDGRGGAFPQHHPGRGGAADPYTGARTGGAA